MVGADDLLPGHHSRGGGVALDRRMGAQRRLEHHAAGHHEHGRGEQGNEGAPANVPRRPRALRMARRSMVQLPRCARCSATWSALGASSVPASRPSASRTTRSACAAATGVMGDHHDRVPVLVDDLAQQREHAAPGLRVQRSGRLVGEHHLGPGDERPGDRDALLLASGELGGTVAQALLQPDPRGDFAHLRAPRAATVQAQRQADVLGDRERRHQVEGLEDEPDPLAPQDRQPPLAEPRQVSVAERDGAGGGPVEPRRNVQERALARPRRPHDRGERPTGEPDGDPVQGDDRAIALAVDLANVAKRDRGS